MENLTRDTLKRLAEQEESPKVSAFIPTFRGGPDLQQNQTRMKNLVSEVTRQIDARELPSDQSEALIAPIRALVEDGEFWKHPTDGIALFAAPGKFEVFKLPYQVDEQVSVGVHYLFTPVMPLITGNGNFYVLALSQQNVALYACTRFGIQPVSLPADMPTNIDDMLQEDAQEKELQFRSSSGQGSAGGVLFHTSSTDNSKDRIQRYLNLVDDYLKPILREQRTPLVLAAVDYLQPIYRQMSEYAHILPQGIEGNPDTLRPEELHAAALPLLDDVLNEAAARAVERYQALNASESATDQIRDVVAAAVWGRVEVLLVNADAEEWGTFDAASGKVVRRREGPRTYDDLALIDFAALHTLTNGGDVYSLRADQMPTDEPVAAILRY